jgi:hypothetical protein
MTKLTLRSFKTGKKEGKGERKNKPLLPVARCKRQT